MLFILMDNDYERYKDEYEGYVSARFDEEFEPEWTDDEFVKRIVREIDDTETIGGYVFHNKVLGAIPPQYLSSGCKCLILAYKTDIKLNGDRLGDNCIDLLLEISENKDVHISLSHIPPFPKYFNAVIENNKAEISSMREYLSEYGKVMEN